MQAKMKNMSNSFLRFTASVLVILILIAVQSCEKESDADFTVDFTYEYVNDNEVRFTNNSQGEYFWLVWDFGNGATDSITDKNAQPKVFYSLAGDYQVTLEVSNSIGQTKSVTKTVSIANDNVVVDFTATPSQSNPNYVVLKNTTPGQFSSFAWKYLDKTIQNRLEYNAYFPFAGTYDIQLIVTVSNQNFAATKTVNIAQDDPNYDPNLIWSEEFEYTGKPDPLWWNMETGGGGWGNNELQFYTNSESNAYVDNGVLTITAREEQMGGRDYTSARITTQNKFDVQYGRIEARIKLPYGQGLWPAFWMLGANFSNVGWPYCGEIDIMEMVGGENKDNTCHATLHWWDDAQNLKADYGLSYTLPSGRFADDFHVFGISWNSQEIRAYVDDNEYFVADLTPAELSEFRQNFFIILNVAVGGNWPGSPDATTVFPQTMQVDWIRVYSE
jgi:beta-glucanase (GH16 family)